jgi:1-acyl-sn-glycerol-3-phosphate acyltransferase
MCSYALLYQALRRDPAALARHTRFWARGLARGWGLQVDVHGSERIPAHDRCVLLANHQSHADVVALFVGLPVDLVFLAKRELRNVPLFGRVMEAGGHIFIDRKEKREAIETVDAAARALRPGHPVLVFPEGTRGRRAEVAPFKKGGFHLARKAGAPIVPIGIRGSRAVWPREARAPRPGRISIHVGEPVPAREVIETPLEELIARVRATIGELAALPLAS